MGFLDGLLSFFDYLFNREEELTEEEKEQKINEYNKKSIMTENEKYFYNIFNKHFSKDYLILPQVNLATIINKNKEFEKQYQNELNRNIDFGIFDKENLTPLLLIEINDNSHNRKDRIKRDYKVKEICKNANLNLITFYTKYSNKENYIVNRINEELKKIK